jgi:hypothetical protein
MIHEAPRKIRRSQGSAFVHQTAKNSSQVVINTLQVHVPEKKLRTKIGFVAVCSVSDEVVVFTGFNIKLFEIKKRIQKSSEEESDYHLRLASVIKIKPEICKL